MTDTLITVPIQGGNLTVDSTTLTAAIAQALGTSTFAATVATPPVSTAAAKKAQILTMLKNLPNNGASKRVLWGQTAAIWSQPLSSTPLDEAPIAAVTTATNKTPAIVGLILNYALNSWAVTPQNTEAEVSQYLAQGVIPHVSLYWNMPIGPAGGTAPTTSPLDATDFHAAVTPGTPQNTIMLALIQQAIGGLIQCLSSTGGPASQGGTGVIMLRPFIEINGNWNWYGAENGADFIALWLMFVNACVAAGIRDNLILVWNLNDNVGNYASYYPGTNQVDVCSIDVYASPSELVSYINSVLPAASSHGKSVIMSEYGGSDNGPQAFTLDNTALLQVLKANFPQIVAVIQFNGSWAIAQQNNATALMTDPWVVTASDLPALLAAA